MIPSRHIKQINRKDSIPYVKGTDIQATVILYRYLALTQSKIGEVPAIRAVAQQYNIHSNQVRACIEYFEPKKKKKKTDYQKLVKKLDDVFSIFIRRRYADDKGIVKCFTCDRRDHWKYMDCSHYMGRQFYPTRWDTTNCQVGCKNCNGFLEGNKVVFARNLDSVYGKGTADKMELMSKNKGNYDRFSLNHFIKQFQRQVDKLN